MAETVNVELPNEALKELLSDCTCPICQEVYTNPHQLNCGHTFCLRCLDKLKRKNQKTSLGDSLLRFGALLESMRTGGLGGGHSDQLQCPVCRSSIDLAKPTKPDATVAALLTALREVKAGCCKSSDCWRPRQVLCTDCACGLCAEHHRAKLAQLRDGCESLAKEAERFLQVKADESSRMDTEMAQAEVQLVELNQALSGAVTDRIKRLRHQLMDARLDLTLETQQMSQVTAELTEDATALRRLMTTEASQTTTAELLSQEMLRRQRQLEGRLRSARNRYPPSRLQLSVDPEKLLAEHATLLSRMSARMLKRPYVEADKLKPSLLRRTKLAEPWEVRLIEGTGLLVNYKGFPTRRLHIFSASSLAETGTVELEMTQAQFPGQTCVCNSRRRILASDPKNHCVYEFNFEGRLISQFGAKGAQQGQLHAPKGLYAYEGVLYVADSKNKRVQMFDMDNGYKCVGSLEHDSIGTNIQAVLAGPECVVVCDRGRDALLVFDRLARCFLKQLPAGGEPFDACCDQFDNVLVTLTRERQVKVYDPSITHCINTFEVGAAEAGPSSSSDGRPLKNYLHGLAYDKATGRLYVAEAFAKRLLCFEM